MDLLANLLVVGVYPLLVVGRILNGVLGRDPLRLREPENKTFWINRGPEPSGPSYFSEASALEGGNHGGCGRLATVALCAVAKLLAPPVETDGDDFRIATQRDRGIPDEVYTLW
jgi:hypothetical protein